MAVTVTTYNVPVTKLEGDGVNGYWWATPDGNGNLNRFSWASASESVEVAGTPVYADTFNLIMDAIYNANIAIADLEFNISIDNKVDQEQLDAQFQTPLLTGANIDTLASRFDAVRLCKYLGVFILVRKMFNRSHLTFAQLKSTLIYLHKRDKVEKNKVENLMTNILAAGEITQAQYDNFWMDWNTEFGI